MLLPGPKKSAAGRQILELGDILIMPSGFNVIYGKQVFYFEDKVLSKRSKLAAPEMYDHLTGRPAVSQQSVTTEIDTLFEEKLNLPKLFIIVVGLVAIGMIAGLGAGLHFNHTASYPRGLWIETTTSETDRPYVLACADHTTDFELYKDRGYLLWGFACSGTAPLLKRIWARSGDTWTVSPDGVTVNGEFVFNTKPLAKDSSDRVLTHAVGGTVPAGHVLLLSDYSMRSLDGRYFGTTPVTQIIKEVKPLWTEQHSPGH